MGTYDRRLDEPPRIAYRVEQRQRFLHTVLGENGKCFTSAIRYRGNEERAGQEAWKEKWERVEHEVQGKTGGMEARGEHVCRGVAKARSREGRNGRNGDDDLR